MKTRIYRFLTDESGQDLIEYTLLVAFVVLGSASLYLNAGNSIGNIWAAGSSQMAAAVTAVS